MEIFKLKTKKHRFSSSYGLYRIYILGGFSIENLNLLDVKLTKINTQEAICITEINWKLREYINGEKAIACYDFQINETDDYEIEFNNIESLEVQKSMLIIKNFFFPSNVSIEDLKIVIK